MPVVFVSIICTLRLKAGCFLEMLMLTNLITTFCHNPEYGNINTFSHKVKSQNSLFFTWWSIFVCWHILVELLQRLLYLAVCAYEHENCWTHVHEIQCWRILTKNFMSFWVLKPFSSNKQSTWRLNVLLASPAYLPKYLSEQKMVSVKVTDESETYVFMSSHFCFKSYGL